MIKKTLTYSRYPAHSLTQYIRVRVSSAPYPPLFKADDMFPNISGDYEFLSQQREMPYLPSEKGTDRPVVHIPGVSRVEGRPTTLLYTPLSPAHGVGGGGENLKQGRQSSERFDSRCETYTLSIQLTSHCL